MIVAGLVKEECRRQITRGMVHLVVDVTVLPPGPPEREGERYGVCDATRDELTGGELRAHPAPWI